jgi:ribosome biogenesis GTPase
MRKVRQQLKNNRKPKRPRQRDWLPDILDDEEALYELDYEDSEPMMPPGEQERRRTVQQAALAVLLDEGAQGDYLLEPMETGGQNGLVVQVSTGLCRVAFDGKELLCSLRGSLSARDTGFSNVIAVGDRVIVSEDGAGKGVVEEILPRRGVLARPDTFVDGGYRVRDRHLQQVIVANVDQLLVVASWREPPIWPELIDRYLVTAERNGLQAIVCLNKVDLVEDEAECRATLQPYLDAGYRVLYSSATSGAGVDELKTVLRDRTTVLTGMSGVGKSSLLNAVQPGLELHTQEISEYHQQGRHTTTHVSLMELEAGGYVVDTPGIREFGLAGVRRAELQRFYPEIADLQGACRFADCSHTHEPSCAVKAAVEAGRLSAARYKSFRAIYEDLTE